MKADENGLVVDEGPGRDLGGSVYFSREEAIYFSNLLGLQIAKVNLKRLAKRKRTAEDGEEDE